VKIEFWPFPSLGIIIGTSGTRFYNAPVLSGGSV
jgi:hypothetical protein